MVPGRIADEPKGKSGIAHFFEHLMFRGTRKHSAWRIFQNRRAGLAGRIMPSPPMISLLIFSGAHRDKLATMMKMEAERMQKLIIDAEIVAIERDVILEERSMRVDGNPSSLLSEKMRARLHDGTPTPYRPSVGAARLSGLTQKMRALFTAAITRPIMLCGW